MKYSSPFRWLMVAGLVAMLPAMVKAQSAERRELQIKTELVLRFAHYVQWPQSATADGQLTICFVENHPIGATLGNLSGREVQGVAVDVRSVKEPAGLTGCNILYAGKGVEPPAAGLLDKAQELPLLTVGEGSGFAEERGMIGLVQEGTRLTFHVNVGASRRVGLQISSQLLRLATVVD